MIYRRSESASTHPMPTLPTTRPVFGTRLSITTDLPESARHLPSHMTIQLTPSRPVFGTHQSKRLTCPLQVHPSLA
jgi:hypothetical protein